jgi:Mn2+/Fe2+ NRAMP family transporter
MAMAGRPCCLPVTSTNLYKIISSPFNLSLKHLKRNSFAAISGAAFLMATSAIGPGFINNTTAFTGTLAASFGFVILISVLLDVVAQLNLWRIITAEGNYAQTIANKTLPGLGHLLTILVAGGGLLFNIGNTAGAALGLQVLTGCSLTTGALVSVGVVLVIFLVKQAGIAMDWFARILGLLMIVLTGYVCITSKPDLPQALLKTFLPDTINTTMILTIVGGTVGGYISFAGAHRLLDAGISGPAHTARVSRGALSGILIASVMRYLLFLAAFGVVAGGVVLSAKNPGETVFQRAAGTVGLKIFGLVLWSAAITSVAGSAFTSVSFLQSLHPWLARNKKMVIVLFIMVSAVVFLIVGNPANLLKKAGAVNGIILPFALGIMLFTVYRNRQSRVYRHPLWLTISGWAVVAVMGWMSVKTLWDMFMLLSVA